MGKKEYLKYEKSPNEIPNQVHSPAVTIIHFILLIFEFNTAKLISLIGLSVIQFY